jgi:hypothetical protein
LHVNASGIARPSGADTLASSVGDFMMSLDHVDGKLGRLNVR